MVNFLQSRAFKYLAMWNSGLERLDVGPFKDH